MASKLIAPPAHDIEAPSRPPTRSNRALNIATVASILGVAATVVLGIWVTPNDQVMGDYVRLLYIHPPMAWVSFVAYGVAFLASLAYLWPRTRSLVFDRLAASSVEVGVVFTALTLVTGSIWGRPTWGTWWTWDPLLTTTALLFVVYVGYLVLRGIGGDRDQRARRSAIAALIAFIDVPVVYFSVYWWQSLHQRPSIDNIVTKQTTIHGSMAWTLLLGFVSFTLAYAVLLTHRIRLARLEDDEEGEGLELALAERRREVEP